MPLEQHIVDRFNAANIPLRFHETQLASAGQEGIDFQTYLKTEYDEDKGNGVGIHVWGDPKRRTALFPLMARALVLRSDNVFYTSMVVLRDVAKHEDHPLSEMVMSSRALFVQGFCTAGEECPYTASDRAEIEEMLTSRAHLGLRNYFSAANTLADCAWWSGDFRVNMDRCMKGYQV